MIAIATITPVQARPADSLPWRRRMNAAHADS
jgi:hypothetical protein